MDSSSSVISIQASESMSVSRNLSPLFPCSTYSSLTPFCRSVRPCQPRNFLQKPTSVTSRRRLRKPNHTMDTPGGVVNALNFSNPISSSIFNGAKEAASAVLSLRRGAKDALVSKFKAHIGLIQEVQVGPYSHVSNTWIMHGGFGNISTFLPPISQSVGRCGGRTGSMRRHHLDIHVI